MLNLRELLAGDVTRLRHITRFSNCRRIHDESVAEHSFYTALYALFIAEYLGFHAVNLGELLAKAVVHDVEESRTGDIPRPFKYSRPELRDEIEFAGNHEFTEVVRGVMLCGPSNQLRSYWLESKNSTLEGKIVAFADFLSVLSYVHQEVRGSNLAMKEHLGNLSEYLGQFECAEFEDLAPLVAEARLILEETLA